MAAAGAKVVAGAAGAGRARTLPGGGELPAGSD